MRREDIKDIVVYYKHIPGMLACEQRERELIEDEYYDGVRAISTDGMPRGGTMGNPTEKMGMRAARDHAAEALAQADIRIKMLEADAAQIKGCMDALNGEYKTLLIHRLVYEYNWAKISVQFARPESTVRGWYEKALDKLGYILENDVVMLDELRERASRAR